MGLFDDVAEIIGAVLDPFVPGPFYTDNQRDYPEDRHDDGPSETE
jgi:hypothetical protein